MVWKIGHGDLGTLRRKGKGDKVLALFFSKKEHKVDDYLTVAWFYFSL